MSHFAKVENGIVTQVIVAEQDVIDSGLFGDPKSWIQTSYNTRGGEHPEGRPLRKNFAGMGYTYDPNRDAFIPPKPWDSWVLDEDRCRWEAPIPRPDDEYNWIWDEPTLSWKKREEIITKPIDTITITEPEIAPVVEPTVVEEPVFVVSTATEAIVLNTASDTISL